MEHALFAFSLVFIAWVLFHAGMHMLFPSSWKTFVVFLATVTASVFAFLLDLLFPAMPLIWMLATDAFLFLSVKYCFEGVPLQKWICAVILTVGIALCALLAQLRMFDDWVFSNLLQFPLPVLLCYTPVFFFIGFLFLCMFVMAAQTILHRKENALSSRWFLFLLLPVSQFFLIDDAISPETMAGSFRQPLMLAFVVSIAIASDQLAIMAINHIVRSREMAVQYEALSRQIQAKETYYQRLASHYELIQYMRHDLDNHVSALKILFEKKDAEELASYLQSLKQTKLFEELHAYCGHPVVNLYLSEKSAEMNDKGIRLDTDLILNPDTGGGSLLLALDSLINHAVRNLSDDSEKAVFLSSSKDEHGLRLTVSYPEKNDPDDLNVLSGELNHADISAERSDGRCTLHLILPEVAA